MERAGRSARGSRGGRSAGVRRRGVARQGEHSQYEDGIGGEPLSAPAIWKILTAYGFAKLPRRADEERPVNARVETAPVSDAR
jgi:hypothetical protein